MSMDHWLNGTDRGRPKYWEYNRCYILCPPQIPHGLAFVRIQASVIKGRRLTISTLTRRTFSVWTISYLSLEHAGVEGNKACVRACDTRTVGNNMADARTSEVEVTPAISVRYWKDIKQWTFVNVHFVEEHGFRFQVSYNMYIINGTRHC
jgi:hypothetical protein